MCDCNIRIGRFEHLFFSSGESYVLGIIRLIDERFWHRAGVYADCDDVKKLVVGEKYANLPASEIRGNKAFMDDLMEADIKMTIRLQIVYGKLNIRSVRNAFQESVGNRLKKFGGLDNDELLQRY